VEPVLSGSGAAVIIAFTAESALEIVRNPNSPDLVLLDAGLPGTETEQLLASIRAEKDSLPIVLIVDTVTEEWLDRVNARVIDDLVLCRFEPAYWELRVEKAMRAHELEVELEMLRDASAREVQLDRLTGVLNRDAILSALFRETDRVQRSSGALTVVLFDIDDFGHWNSRLGVNACDEILCQVATRTARLLRSYDVLGRTGKNEFLIGLPGCATPNAAIFAERLRMEVFAEPYHVSGEAIRLSACFGVAQSLGRSPVVVLREAEQALMVARQMGPESINFGGLAEPAPPPITFLSATSGEELLAW